MIKPDSMKYQVLEMVGISGEFPVNQLHRLIESSSYAEKIITELKNEKLIRTHYRDRLRGYRLTKHAKELLLAQNMPRFHDYLTGNTETNLIRSELPRRIRLHQKAEIYLTLLHANIPIFYDVKPNIFSRTCEADSSFIQDLPLFYSSREIKTLGYDTTKIRNSRSVGILLSPQCVYALYNTGNSVLKWEYKTEVRLTAFLQHYLQGRPYHGRPAVVVEGGAEGENSPEGNENAEPQTKTVTFTRHTYTVQYAGDAYFADHVFHLTDEQKKLAQDYAENLTTFFGNAASGVAMAINLSDEVLSYRPAVERIAAKYGMSEYVELILAVMMQESGGRGLDVMQAAEGSFNTKYPHKPNGITDPEYSIECGIQELKYALEKAGCTGPTDLDRIKLALQGYNYGSGYIDWAMERDGGYTKENAIAYSDMMCARPSWPYDRYGDKEYVEHVLRYYQITNSGGSYPANGMQIPHYLQTDYGNIPYGGGSIASSGCGPTSFAMIASYLTDTTITPADAVAWCGNSYYMPGVGTYWSYFQAAANHFGCGSVTQTSDANQVLQALSEGHPVISSQRAGLFTSGGHFIVLRGVTADSKVLVNDPNDNSSKNYINREFDMMSEVHATSNAYWIFDKK